MTGDLYTTITSSMAASIVNTFSQLSGRAAALLCRSGKLLGSIDQPGFDVSLVYLRLIPFQGCVFEIGAFSPVGDGPFVKSKPRMGECFTM